MLHLKREAIAGAGRSYVWYMWQKWLFSTAILGIKQSLAAHFHSDFCKGQEQAGCLDSHNLQSGFGDTHVQQTWNIDRA